MTRSETTKMLSDLLIAQFGRKITYWASEVTFDYSTNHSTRVDFMQFEPVNQSISGIEKGIFTCYEVKSCKEDFETDHGHNFYGEKNYYVMTEETYQSVKKKLDSSALWFVGVYIEQNGKLVCTKQCKKRDRKRPALEMLFMMFRSGRG